MIKKYLTNDLNIERIYDKLEYMFRCKLLNYHIYVIMEYTQYNIRPYNIIGNDMYVKYISIQFYELLCKINQTESVKIIQTGGTLEHFNINGHIYKMKIQRILTENEYGNNLEILLFSPIGVKYKCGLLTIEKDTNIAHLNFINLHENCIVEKVITDNFASEMTIRENIGTLIIKIMIKICEQEKVKQIRLYDNSYITCNGGGTMQLKYIHTLTKGVPWYSKFEFVPESKEHLRIFKYNYDTMKKYLTNDLNIEHIFKHIRFLCKQEKLISNEIINLFKEHSLNKLYDTIKEISKNDKYCNVFSKIYEEIYRKLKLEKYSSNLIMIKNY